MNLRCAVAVTLILLPVASFSQTEAGTLPASTPLALTIDRNYPMRAGEAIRARLLYPIFADNKLLLPKGTVVSGKVVELRSDRSRRINAELGGDFTPFHIPTVQFNRIVLADGSSVALSAGTATDGAPIYRAVTPTTAKGGFVRRHIDAGLDAARRSIAVFTAPGKGDRMLQFLYGWLPYHPQRIEKGTAWTVETTASLNLPAQPAPPAAQAAAPRPPAARKPHLWEQRETPTAPPATDKGTWTIQANLAESISSETSTKGQHIQAIVAEPIYNADRTVAVPQGATLVGAITRAKPARRFGRTGVLGFSFNQIELPNTPAQTVETRLTGADSAAQIALNSEGDAQSKPQSKIAVPLVLALMASRPLDQDQGAAGSAPGQAGRNGIGGAAGLGLVGIAVGIAGGSPYAAAGIGYWGAARAVYSRWIAHGQKIAFAKDTRIVVETTPRHSAPIKPNAQP